MIDVRSKRPAYVTPAAGVRDEPSECYGIVGIRDLRNKKYAASGIM